MNSRKIIILPFMIFVICFIAKAQSTYKQKLVYTLDTAKEQIKYGESHLYAYNNVSCQGLVVESGENEFLIFNGKKWGPFDKIDTRWTNGIAWTVKKENKYYMLIPIYDKIEGPYQELGTFDYGGTFISSTKNMKHYGYRAKKKDEWFVIIDGKEFGPYAQVQKQYPIFSEEGNNWCFEYDPITVINSEKFVTEEGKQYKLADKYFMFKKGPIVFKAMSGNIIVSLTEKSYNYFYVKQNQIADSLNSYLCENKLQCPQLTSFYRTAYSNYNILEALSSRQQRTSYTGYSISYTNIDWSGTESYRYTYGYDIGGGDFRFGYTKAGYAYDMKMFYNKTLADSLPIHIFKADAQYLVTKFDSYGPYNGFLKFEITNGHWYAIAVKYYMRDDKIDANVYIIVDGRTYGPYYDINHLSLARNGTFIAHIINPHEEENWYIVVNGEIKNNINKQNSQLEVLAFNDFTGSYMVGYRDSSIYFKDSLIGKYNLGNIHFVEPSDNYCICYSTGKEDYFYNYYNCDTYFLSTLNKEIKTYITAISTDGKHFGGYMNEKIYIDDKPVGNEKGFSLIFDASSNSFKWLSVLQNKIFLNEYTISKK
ncbi:MAG: hypothetical protein ACK5D8_05100 [Bacteroidota bacterium]